MRPNPGDEYTITELNQMNWPFDNTPKVVLNCLFTRFKPLTFVILFDCLFDLCCER